MDNSVLGGGMLPNLKLGTGTLVGTYRFGTYFAMLFRDPEGVDLIDYRFVLAILASTVSTPVLTITCERSRLQEALLASVRENFEVDAAARSDEASWYLCVVNADGDHENISLFKSPPDPTEFREVAFREARSRLNVADEVRDIPAGEIPSSKGVLKRNRQGYILFGLISLFAAAVTVFVWFSRPRSFDDCVLESMKGVSSDMAAKAIYQSCRKKFQ